MWRRGTRGDDEVTCIACGETLPRSDAREYDKHGNRWERRNKEFESLCKPCHRELCHQPRAELESLLVEIGAGTRSREEFLSAYAEAVQERERDSERGRESGR